MPPAKERTATRPGDGPPVPTKPPKPTPLRPDFERMPRHLRRLARWVLWRYEWSAAQGKWTKVPYRADGRGKASTTNADTWATFEAARDAYERGVNKADGVGWVVGEGITGVDVDACRDPEAGTLTEDAAAVVAELRTYTEASPSATGVRAFALGDLPPKGRKRGPLEMYDGDGGRYLTVTGHQLDGTPDEPKHRGAELAAIHARHIARPEPKPSTNGEHRGARVATGKGAHLSDADVLERMRRAKPAAAALYDGDTSAHNGDHSAADLALVSHLAWWTDYDAAQVDRLFRDSKLMRPKWTRSVSSDGELYGERTIRTAFEGHAPGDGYRPRAGAPADLEVLGREPGDTGPIEADAPPEVRARDVADSPPRSARRSPDLAGDPMQGMTRELAEALASFRDSDLGNGERLAYLYGDRMLFVPGIGAHVYDGTRWRLDDAGMVHRYAKRMLRMLYAAAAMLGEGDSDRAAALAKHAARSERGRALDLAIERAWRGQEVAELIVRADELDADPDLLNVANGTIHLPTGRLRPHNPRDRITKLCPVVYDPTARAPLWEAFQERITNGDRELIEYKRRAFGYTLTGHTNEQAVFIAHGAGANGKSTELELVADVGGDYAAAASFDTFASTRDGKVQRFGLAGLAGARFVRASEGEAGAKLAEGTVKVVTGGEVMRAEYKGRDAFEFRPRFALWLATNHRPETRGTDHGLWRRIKLVPYTVTIPEAERDRDLPAKLRAELPGILAWLVEGARAWYADGLREPPAVTDATTAYRADMDVLADFLDAYVRRDDPNAYEGSSRLHDAYEAWCRHNREAAVSQKALSGMLAERGFTKRRTRSGIVWDGLKLTEEGEAAADEAATVKGVGR